MKKINSVFYLIVMIIGFLFSGCTEKTDTTPENATRSSYIGKWSVSESWNKLAYEVNITADQGSTDGVFISNFANTGTSSIPAGAVVSGSSIVLDANQVISGITINGAGTLSGTDRKRSCRERVCQYV